MRPSSAEGLVGTLILDSCPLEDLESRISNLESRISGHLKWDSVPYGTSRRL